MTKKVQKEKFSIKLTFNPEHPLDAELIKVLKNKNKMASYIKLAVYHYISVVEKNGSLNEPGNMVRVQQSLQKERAVSPGKEKSVHQWDKDAAFADAFEPLK